MRQRDESSIFNILLSIILIVLCSVVVIVISVFATDSDSSEPTGPSSSQATDNTESSPSTVFEITSEKSTSDIEIITSSSDEETTSAEEPTSSHVEEPTSSHTEEPTTPHVDEPTSSGVEDPTSSQTDNPTTIDTGETSGDIPPVIITNVDPYDYTVAVPVTNTVTEEYFSDAVFIGDSLTDGLKLYSSLKTPVFYSKQALSTTSIFSTPVVNVNGQTLPILDALPYISFNKVYIMLGINEVGYPTTTSFEQKYTKIIDTIRTINPDAVIYVQSILPITEKASNTHKYIKNKQIAAFNSALLKLAAEKKVYFLNVAEALSDSTGALRAEASSDGVHLKPSYYNLWYEYLKNHSITAASLEPPAEIPTEPTTEIPTETSPETPSDITPEPPTEVPTETTTETPTYYFQSPD
ncbi:MAG: hypothetical protein IJW18_01165 [Lachnospiraceae bacterium]|nr:hypothetical protein [Lachnospiraceae bacterium]